MLSTQAAPASMKLIVTPAFKYVQNQIIGKTCDFHICYIKNNNYFANSETSYVKPRLCNEKCWDV